MGKIKRGEIKRIFDRFGGTMPSLLLWSLASEPYKQISNDTSAFIQKPNDSHRCARHGMKSEPAGIVSSKI